MACDYRPKHRIYMGFFLRQGWFVSFLEPDLKTPLARTFNFADPEKIRDLARRGAALDTLEAKQMLEQAIETGRGGLFLSLTEDQYQREYGDRMPIHRHVCSLVATGSLPPHYSFRKSPIQIRAFQVHRG
jgi:hypothetical protein